MSGREDLKNFFEIIQRERNEMNVTRYPQRPMIEGDRFYQTQKVF